jgi:glycosyltransferase involved in cell wall biosynthesis
MTKRGHQVTVLKLGQKGDQPFVDGKVQVHSFAQGPWHYYLSRIPFLGKHLGLPAREIERSWALRKALEALHARQPIDIVEFSEEAVFFSTFSYLRKHCVYLARLHGTEHAWVPKVPGKKLSPALKMQRALQGYFLKRCENLLAVSEFYKNDLRADLGEKAYQRMRVAENPVAGLEAIKKPNSTLPALPTFFFIGRIQDTKGVDLLLKALGELKQAGYRFQLLLAGSHHPSIGEARFNKWLDQYHIRNQVKYLGHCSQATLQKQMQEVSAVVVPSYFETFGLVGIEAICQGVALIHSKVGIWEQCQESETLALFEPANLEALKLKLTGFLKGEQHNSQPLRKSFFERFRLSPHLDFYESLVNDKIRQA